MKRVCAAVMLFSAMAAAASHKPYWGYLVRIENVMTNPNGVVNISAHDELPAGKTVRHFSFNCNRAAASCAIPGVDQLYRTDVPKVGLYKCDNYMLCREGDVKCIPVCLDSVY
jgi:hypothetical protein